MKPDNEFFIKKASPVQELQSLSLTKADVRLWVKRDDLLLPVPSGNKWRKLKYNLEAAIQQNSTSLLTFGGAYSNHIYAVAQAGQALKIPTIGLIRGERPQKMNPTLDAAEKMGMQLQFIDRTSYRKRHDPSFQEELLRQFPGAYLLPEGGTNNLAIKGCAEIPSEIRTQLPTTSIDYWCVACGTGGTFSGLVAGLPGKGQALGFSVLKGDFMRTEVEQLLQSFGEKPQYNWSIQKEYHFGGYAKFDERLIHFMNAFKQEHDITLDPIYTGKLFYGLFDLVEQGYFPKGSTIMAIHTGGLQGIAGFNERFGRLLE